MYVDKFIKLTNDNLNPSTFEVDFTILNELTNLFRQLSYEFEGVDGTHAGRQKQLQMANIANTLYTVMIAIAPNERNYLDLLKKQGEIVQNSIANALEIHRIADTGKHLPRSEDSKKDDFWANRSKGLRAGDFLPLWIAYNKQNNFLQVQVKKKEFVVIQSPPELNHEIIDLQSFSFKKSKKKILLQFRLV